MTQFETLDQFRIDLHNRIFTNRTLNLNSIKVVGFDMDYTLVIYNEERLEAEAFARAAEHLVSRMGYPEAVRSLKFSAERIIRGLVIDKKLGNLVKINRFGYIKSAVHGERAYGHDEQKAAYAHEIVRLDNPRYEMVHTLFSLACCSLFCQMVDVHQGGRSYEELYGDVSRALDLVHRDGTLKARIQADPAKFVLPDPSYAETLRMLKASGKKLALITNSEWTFTQAMMSHAYDPYLPEGTTWRDLFSVVIVDAAKPHFFTGRTKFYEVIPDTGHLKNVASEGPKLGRIYQGGSSAGVEEMFHASSSDILYVGDHIYSDVHQSKKNCKWRTMLVITELEAELLSAEKGRENLARIRQLMEEKERLELQLGQISKRRHTKVSYVKALETLDDASLSKLQSRTRERITVLDAEVGKLINDYNSRFNPHWGELMWAGNDKSHFGMSVERHACVYTSRVSNLMFYSASHYFRPPVKVLA